MSGSSLRRFVVTRPFHGSNVGSNLSSLAGAIYLAERLGRDLVIDWRGMSQLRDKSLNYFREFFDFPDRFRGVRIMHAPVDLDYGTIRPLSANEAGAIAVDGTHARDDILVLQEYHGLDRLLADQPARVSYLRGVYRELRPGAEVQRAIAEFVHQLDAPFVIAVNVRTGNGHYFGKDGPYAGRIALDLFERQDEFLRAIARGCRRRAQVLPRALRDAARIFFATDSPDMSEILSLLPGSVTRRRVFPPAGEGDTYSFSSHPDTSIDRIAVVDTIADMFLLAECDALIYNSSVFNQYARVVTGLYGGNLVHLETLFLRQRLRANRDAVLRRLAPRG